MPSSTWGLVALLTTAALGLWTAIAWTARTGTPNAMLVLLAVALTLGTLALPWVLRAPSTYVPRKKVHTCAQCGTLWAPDEADGAACPACGPV